MISFSSLGKTGARLGNQLFQYAFLRTQAKRLGVTFYCPKWYGESVFDLHDKEEKGDAFQAVQTYNEDPYQHGFSSEAIQIQDNTDVAGYFQSHLYFSHDDITKWYSFKNEITEPVLKKYHAIDFTKAVAVHVRLGDYQEGSLMFYTPTPKYFKDALRYLNPQGDIIVFSEGVEKVKNYLGEMPANTIFVEGNKDYEDFYLMTLCKDIVISPSSFSWWAAYLNKHETKQVVMPQHWYIPSSPVTNKDLVVPGWKQIPGHRVILDNYYYRYVYLSLRKLFAK